MYLTVVAELSAALLNMIGPVATGVLNFGRKTLLNPTSLSIDYQHTGGIYTADVLLK